MRTYGKIAFWVCGTIVALFTLFIYTGLMYEFATSYMSVGDRIGLMLFVGFLVFLFTGIFSYIAAEERDSPYGDEQFVRNISIGVYVVLIAYVIFVVCGIIGMPQ